MTTTLLILFYIVMIIPTTVWYARFYLDEEPGTETSSFWVGLFCATVWPCSLPVLGFAKLCMWMGKYKKNHQSRPLTRLYSIVYGKEWRDRNNGPV